MCRTCAQVEESVWDVCAGRNGTTDVGAGAGAGEASALGGPRYTTSGEACVFPATYLGSIVTDCVNVGGMPRCQARPKHLSMRGSHSETQG